MKPGDKHELLDTILEDAASQAPTADEVLVGIRGEKRTRANRRMIAGTVVSVLLVALFVSQSQMPAPPTENQVTHAVTNLAPPAPTGSVQTIETDDGSPESEWKIARVNDQQLLDMLVDTPVALTQDSDGETRLMMVVAAED